MNPDYDSRNFITMSHDRIKTLDLGNPDPKARRFGATGRHLHHIRGVDTPNAAAELISKNHVWSRDTNWRGRKLDKSDPLIQKIVDPDYVKNLAEAEMVKVPTPTMLVRISCRRASLASAAIRLAISASSASIWRSICSRR